MSSGVRASSSMRVAFSRSVEERRPLLEQLLAGETDDEDRPLALVREVLDELEERRLRPVDVVEDEDERCLARPCLAELAEEPRDLGGGRRRLGIERGEHGVALLALGRLGEDLAQRPVRDALAVGETAAPERCHALRPSRELGSEPRLPHSRRRDDERDPSRAAVDRALERPSQRCELSLPADERRIEAALEGRRERLELEQAERVNPSRQALDRELAERLEPGDVVDETPGAFSHDDLVRGG